MIRILACGRVDAPRGLRRACSQHDVTHGSDQLEARSFTFQTLLYATFTHQALWSQLPCRLSEEQSRQKKRGRKRKLCEALYNHIVIDHDTIVGQPAGRPVELRARTVFRVGHVRLFSGSFSMGLELSAGNRRWVKLCPKKKKKLYGMPCEPCIHA